MRRQAVVLHFQREMDTDNKKFACPECGSTIKLGAQTCPNCGKAQDVSAKPGPAFVDPVPPHERVPSYFIFGLTVPYQAEPDEKFLRGYSLSPGCWFYLFSRVFWPLAVISYFISQIHLWFYNPNLDFMSLGEQPWQLTIRVLDVVLLSALIALGIVARRLRWRKLKWKSFSEFKADEFNWDIWGAIGWLIVISLIALQVYITSHGILLHEQTPIDTRPVAIEQMPESTSK
jgi:hypothetical protein